jgi:hypothetical protein
MAKLICPECGKKKMKTKWQYYYYPFGIHPHRALLDVYVPVRVCKVCTFSYLDCEAEDIIDAKTREHINERDRGNERTPEKCGRSIQRGTSTNSK